MVVFERKTEIYELKLYVNNGVFEMKSDKAYYIGRELNKLFNGEYNKKENEYFDKKAKRLDITRDELARWYKKENDHLNILTNFLLNCKCKYDFEITTIKKYTGII